MQRLLRRTKRTTNQVAADQNHKQEQQEQQGRRHTRTHEPSQNHTTKPAKRNYTTKGAKVYNTNKVAKHPPDRPTVIAKHPPEVNSNQRRRRQSIRQSSTAAKYLPTKRKAVKHPPTDDQRNLGNVEETKRRQAHKWIHAEKSKRPPPA